MEMSICRDTQPEEIGLENPSPEVDSHPPQPAAELADYWDTVVTDAFG